MKKIKPTLILMTFIAVFSTIGLRGQAAGENTPPRSVDAIASRLLERFDTDGNGELSAAEFAHFLETRRPARDDARAAFGRKAPRATDCFREGRGCPMRSELRGDRRPGRDRR